MYDLYWDKDLVTTRMNLIFSSGIYQEWEEIQDWGLREYYRKLSKNTGSNSDPSPMSLKTNIVTIFALYACLVLLSIISSIVECHRKVWTTSLCSSSCMEGTRVKPF